MDTKTILVAVADPQSVLDITQALGDGWETTSVSTEAEALAHLAQRAFDALLVDFNLGSPDASQLLNQALEAHPDTVRFLLAYEADLALVAAYVSGQCEILPKPVEPGSLKARVERAVAAQHASLDQCGEGGGAPGFGESTAPVVPAVYAEVLKALELPGVTPSQVGGIIAGDAALTDEVLRLTQSAYLGLPGNLTNPVEAVAVLGSETVKALVMARRFLAEHSHLNPGYLSFEQMWQYSIRVAQRARDLMLFETEHRGSAAEALMAGLLHDLGKVVLVSNYEDLYGRVHSLARNQPVALWAIEKEMFGASHGEIGACLAGMWNMPSSVVQAVAFHHEPPLGEYEHLSPLAAVHVATVLEHELGSGDEFRVAPVMSTAFLNEIGLLQRLPVWRAVFTKRRDASARPEVERPKTSEPQLTVPVLSSAPPPSTANQFPAAAASTRTATDQPGVEEETPVAPASRKRRWVYAGAAVALGLVTIWVATRPQLPVRARITEATPVAASIVVSPVRVNEPASTVVTEAAPTIAVAEVAPVAEAILAPQPAPTPAEPEPIAETAPLQPETVTAAAPPTPVTEEKAQPDFRLHGIIYSAARPMAIVNGQTVFVGDRVGGATVETIGKKTVTLRTGERVTSLILQETQ